MARAGKTLIGPRKTSQCSLLIQFPYMLFYPLCSPKKSKIFFFSREPELPDFIKKRFYSNSTDKRTKLTKDQTIEVNIVGNM